jgi:hypothetical protein
MTDILREKLASYGHIEGYVIDHTAGDQTFMRTASNGDTKLEDVVGGYVPGRPFKVTRSLHNGGTITGKQFHANGNLLRTFSNYPMTVREVPAYRIGHLELPARSADADLVKQLLGRTNPFKPVLGVPQFVYELRDIPATFRSYGKSIIRGLARGHLTYEFGIKPLVSDLHKLRGLIETSQRRANFWRKLQTEGHATSAVTLESVSANESAFVDCHTSDGYFSINCPSMRNSYRVIRGYVIWETTANFPEVPEDITNLFARAMTGQTLDLANLWQVLPWSWLVDWFSSVGDTLEANRGSYYVTPKGVRLMSTVKTTRSIPTFTGIPSDLTVPYTSLYETKERWVPNLEDSSPLSVPIFSVRQGLIASSLIASRGRWRS